MKKWFVRHLFWTGFFTGDVFVDFGMETVKIPASDVIPSFCDSSINFDLRLKPFAVTVLFPIFVCLCVKMHVWIYKITENYAWDGIPA